MAFTTPPCAPVFGRESAGQDLEFLNRVNSQDDPDDVSGRRHGVITYADSINPVIVESGPLAGDGHFSSEAAVAAGGSRKGHLRLDHLYAGLNLGQRSPSRPFKGNSRTVSDSTCPVTADDVSSICGAAPVT